MAMGKSMRGPTYDDISDEDYAVLEAEFCRQRGADPLDPIDVRALVGAAALVAALVAALALRSMPIW